MKNNGINNIKHIKDDSFDKINQTYLIRLYPY